MGSYPCIEYGQWSSPSGYCPVCTSKSVKAGEKVLLPSQSRNRKISPVGSNYYELYVISSDGG